MIEYRKATMDDMEELLRVRIDFLLDAKNISSEQESEQIRSANQAFLEETLADGSFVQWLGLDDGQIVATSSVSFYRLPPNKSLPNSKAAYIGNMYTYPPYRNQGIATKLLALAIQEARDRGCGKIELHATDMGRPLYERFGFKDTADYMVCRFSEK